MEKILIVHTGGTIAMSEHSELGTVLSSADHPLKAHFETLKTHANIVEDYLFDLPSPHVTPKHMLKLGQHIKEKVMDDSIKGVVVTHGTDTLEETAYFLDLYLGTDKPVVITGAMRSSNEVGADGLYNMVNAVRVANATDSKFKGVLVVMNDEIHSSAYCIKTSSSNVATFQSPQFGPVGIITKQEVYYYHKWIERERIKFDEITKNVVLIKAFAGMEANFLEKIAELNLDGLVIEGFGQGNLPPEVVPAIKRIIENQVKVVMVSRSFKGVVQPTYGYPGGGRDLKDCGVIFAKRLSGPKARIKLLALLEAGMNFKEIEAILEK